jgi:preprotein translocase subunit SecY
MELNTNLVNHLFGSQIIFFIIVALVVFFIGREIACWYFKINDIKKLLEEIEENTRKEK